jgi:hypothetical protein
MLIASSILVLMLAVQAPPQWEQTYRKSAELVSDEKYSEAIALLESAVKAAPAFDAAHYELGHAHEMAAARLQVEKTPRTDAIRQHLEAAAAEYRQVVALNGQYRTLAVALLMRVYDDTGLNDPRALAGFAREYIKASPESAMGHAKLAEAQLAVGDEAGSIATLLAARTAVQNDGQQPLAVFVVEHLTKTSGASRGDTKQLLDFADTVLDRSLAREPDDRMLLMAKAASLTLRADRVEQNPERQRAVRAEGGRVFDKARGTDSTASVQAPPPPPPNGSGLLPLPPAPELPGAPPGFNALRDKAAALHEQKRFKEEVALYSSAVKERPAFVYARYERLRAQISDGEHATEATLGAARQGGFATPEEHHIAGTYLWDIAKHTKPLSAEDARALLKEAIAQEDEALKAGETRESLVYKSLALRDLAQFERDPAAANKLIAEADRLRARAMNRKR